MQGMKKQKLQNERYVGRIVEDILSKVFPSTVVEKKFPARKERKEGNILTFYLK